MTDAMNSGATLSADGRYRYDLTRRWGDGPVACWVMLNPSTADASVDDPTIRRCASFSRAAGMGGLVVVNLFAFRATDPADLAAQADPAGPDNRQAVARHAYGAALVVAAWGAHAMAKRSAVRWQVLGDLAENGRFLWCLGRTRNGSPRHPLYVAASVPFEPFEP